MKFFGSFARRFKSARSLSFADEKCNAAHALFKRGECNAAIAMCLEVLSRWPNHHGSILVLAEVAVASREVEQAIELYAKAVSINPNDSLTHYKHGNVLKDYGRMEEALASYNFAVALNPNHNAAFCNRGVVLHHLKQLDAALDSYDHAVELNPNDPVSHYNRGVLLREIQRPAESLASFTRAIAASPVQVEALCNRGMLLQERGEWQAALTDFDRAIAIMPEFAEAHYNRAESLIQMKQFFAAIESYDRAISFNPNLQFALGMRRYAKMQLCDWRGQQADAAVLTCGDGSSPALATPFTILTLVDSVLFHRQAAQVWINKHHPTDSSLPVIARRAAAGKIRLGYFSADFFEHPVAVLAAQFLAFHDRSKYEVIAFSFGPDTQDPMRKRLERIFDKFIDVREKSDYDVALLARSLGIDIAVNLNGHTAGSRTGIFALRSAPVQISFLGYPGTMGAEYIDYIVGDTTVIPEEYKQYYSEKILFLPDSFLPHDSGRAISSRQFTREQLGLPPSGIVFCCFNNSYKVMPGTFDIWMRILDRVDNSVLWLSQNNSTATENLRREAKNRGIEAQRLIFADRMPSTADHLARIGKADLFLDTLPYNAHATALDALWSGLPILTCIGHGFAGRVAASLLKAVGLTELITSTATQYEDLAVELAENPQFLSDIRVKLERNRLTTPLFDTALFTKNLEHAYARVYERYQADLPTDHIVVRD